MAIALLTLQAALLLCFVFFAFFNYLYAFAALLPRRLKKAPTPNRTIAVVIVSYNERHVVRGTVEACERLTHLNRLIVLSDDSDDPESLQSMQDIARSRGCRLTSVEAGIEIWEGAGFLYLHRDCNRGFKGGNVRETIAVLRRRGIDLIYLLDADWHPQPDALERLAEVLEAEPAAAFVQSRRVTFSAGIALFQRYVAISEEGCYYVDFEGRQALGHPALFSGCCTLLRLDAVDQVGGFPSGHLTEDLDLTNRLWLAGWKGIYCGDVINYGEVPFGYRDFARQQARWAAGTGRCLRDYFWPLLRCRKLSWIERLSAVRQNAYFSSGLLSLAAILTGMATVLWLAVSDGSYGSEWYLWVLQQWQMPVTALVYASVLSNFAEPLVMIVCKKRRWLELLHVPMAVWYAWSILFVYVAGNLKGLIRTGPSTWSVTPKFMRGTAPATAAAPRVIRVLPASWCAASAAFYAFEGWHFGWFDPFAFLLLPAFVLASRE